MSLHKPFQMRTRAHWALDCLASMALAGVGCGDGGNGDIEGTTSQGDTASTSVGPSETSATGSDASSSGAGATAATGIETSTGGGSTGGGSTAGGSTGGGSTGGGDALPRPPQCDLISRDQVPFNVDQSTFSDDDLVRQTVQGQQPVINGVSLFIPDMPDQPLIGCGYVDPTGADFGADPTGVADSTVALNAALDFARRNFLAVYVPSGTYRISAPLECRQVSYQRNNGALQADNNGACMLMGGHDGPMPTIVLEDAAVGFDDPTAPASMVYFWGIGGDGTVSPNPAGTYNHGIDNVRFVVGNNPGAAAVRIAGAQGCFIHDVSIDAHGGFAGIVGGAMASGGSMVNVTIDGGQYGLYHRSTPADSRPVGTAAALTLVDQTASAIYHGNGVIESFVVVGADIQMAASATGPAIMVDAGAANTGQFVLVDSQIDFINPSASNVALDTDRSFHMSNVFVRGAGYVAQGPGAGDPVEAAPADPATWSWVQSLTYGVQPPPKNITGLGSVQVEMPLYRDGVRLVETSESTFGPAGTTPPVDLTSRHGWGDALPAADSLGAVNVKTEYGAVGDGVTDDTAAIQAAIDAAEIVFLPKGYYLVSSTLQLAPDTKLVGVARTLSVLVAAESGALADEANPRPVIATADDAEATTVVSNVGIYIPVANGAALAVDWRAGDRSLWRNGDAMPFRVHGFGSQPEQTAVARVAPMVQFSGNGGGRWYGYYEIFAIPAGSPNYRSVAVQNTVTPLRFYQLNSEHNDNSDAFVSIEGASNVAVFGFKSEDDKADPANSPILHIAGGSEAINIFGSGGYVTPADPTGVPLDQLAPSLYRVESSTDIRLVSLIDRLGPESDALNALSVAERTSMGDLVRTDALDRPILYEREATPWHLLESPRAP